MQCSCIHIMVSHLFYNNYYSVKLCKLSEIGCDLAIGFKGASRQVVYG